MARSERVMPIMFEYALVGRAKADRRHSVLPEGDEERILRAAEILLQRGEFAGIYHELRKHKGLSEQMALDTVADVSYFGTLMVDTGLADGMVSGAVHSTGDTIRPARPRSLSSRTSIPATTSTKRSSARPMPWPSVRCCRG